MGDTIDFTPFHIADDTIDAEFGKPRTRAGSLNAPANILSFTKDIKRLRTASELITAIYNLGLPGPLMLTDPLNSKSRIGEGSQFIVYENVYWDSYTTPAIYQNVAVKKCKFNVETKAGKVDLTSELTARQVHDMYLEVVTLCDPILRSHRNIVRLLGFGNDSDHFQAPLLVQELATEGDLASFLHKEPRLSWEVRHHLCLDIGAALDAIHSRGVVHGDIKPSNVLVFKNYHGPATVPFVAKLADFGYAIDDEGDGSSEHGGGCTEVMGYTPGWQAPEIDEHLDRRDKIRVSTLMKSDNYTYGLLIWSVCVGNGDPLQKVRSASAVQASVSNSTLPLDFQRTLLSALEALLVTDYETRPSQVATLLQTGGESGDEWQAANAAFLRTERHSSVENSEEPQKPEPFIHPWNLTNIEPLLFQPLEVTYETQKADLSENQLFCMFLEKSFSYISKPPDDISRPKHEDILISMLLDAARLGFVPAQAVATRVMSFYGRENEVSEDVLREWLVAGATTGSWTAMKDLFSIDPTAAEQARQEFLKKGGYNTFFSPDAPEYVEGEGNNSRTAFGETPIYRACLAGLPGEVVDLCQEGADASVSEDLDGLTPLHWLFNFETCDLEAVGAALCDAGARINALSFNHWSTWYHFPFLFPPGTSLHWAVWTGNEVAVKCLLGMGADPTLRNGMDPYAFDRNARRLNAPYSELVGDVADEGYECMGFSSIDLAAALCEWRILQLLLESPTTSVSLSSHVDEEGYTPLHRLEYFRVGRNKGGARYNGASMFRFTHDSILQTIRTLTGSGLGIDTLTSPKESSPPGGVGGLTPLMLASLAGDVVAVEALISYGADVNFKNRLGCTPLMFVPRTLDEGIPVGAPHSITKILIDAGADANAISSDGNITPLAAADLEEFPLLLASGADPYVQVQGLAPVARAMYLASGMHVAAHAAKIMQIVQILIASGRGINAPLDGDGGTLLHYAARHGLAASVRILLQSGADSSLGRLKTEGRPFPPKWFHGTALEIAENALAEFEEDVFESRSRFLAFSREEHTDLYEARRETVRLLRL